MKTFLLATMALIISGSAHALVSDRFKCTMALEDPNSGNTAKQEQEFNITRLSLSASPAPDVRITGGNADSKLHLLQKEMDLSANIQLYYQHAVRLDPNGKPVEARQVTCLNIGYSYCKKQDPPPGTPNIGCFGMQSKCYVGLPYDPNHPWDQVDLINDVPAFNLRAELSTDYNGTDEQGKVLSRINVVCQYMGTYN